MTEKPETQLFDSQEIQAAVKKIAETVSVWLKNNPGENLKVVSILEGARPITRDLVNQLQLLKSGLEIEIVEVQVKGTAGTHLLESRQWDGEIPNPDTFKDARIMLVDDLVDSGKTLGTLKNYFMSLGAKEVKTAVLIRKFGLASGPVDFCGFDLNLDRKSLAEKGLEDYWLFGYGMDYDGGQREMDSISWVPITKK